MVAVGAITGLLAACGFGVDLDGIFGGSGVGPADDGGDGSATDANVDGTIPKVQVVQIGVGDEFACGRRIDGTVMCWGTGDDGRLGDGQELSSSKPVLVRDLADAVDLSVGDDHACAVKKDGTAVCWGQNSERQLGDGANQDAITPHPVVALTDAVQVSAGGNFSCALKKDATVQCWGENASGQLGDNTTSPRASAGPVPGLSGVKQIAVAYDAACALLESGEVSCWGENESGATGIGANGADVLVPTKVPGLTGVASLGHGGSGGHFCAVLATGAAQCWGPGGSGQIGNAQNPSIANKPTAVVGITDASVIATGNNFTCIARKTGAVSCFGSNGWRQLGLGDTNPPGGTNTAVAIDGLTGVEQVAAGNDFACALHTGGDRISCWGSNRQASLGRDTRLATDVPLKVDGVGGVANVGLGASHTCATTTAGDVYCWGYNNYQQQAASSFAATGTPTKVTAIGGGGRIVGGESHTCGIFGADVKCWGHNQYGQLGNGQNNYIQTDPVTLQAAGVTDLGAGYMFTCALTGAKQLACAGLNDDGRLGSAGGNANVPRVVQIANPDALDAGADADAGDDGGADAGPPPPATIDLANVQRLGMGRIHNCAVHGGGKVSCWGSPWDGRLGINTNTFRTNPIEVSLPMPATDVACGNDHTCAVLSDGSIRCWGANYYGQLSGGGDNGASQRTPNLNGKQAKAVTAGGSHTCALLTDQTVVCWGHGKEGQLGNALRADQTQPVAVSGLAGVTYVEAEADRTCAITSDGTLLCWGDNSTGALGDGVLMVTGVPGAVFGY